MQLVDRLIAFLKSRKNREVDFLTNIVNPLVAEFEVVGKDYLSVFREMERELADDNTWDMAFSKLKVNGQQLKTDRIVLAERMLVLQYHAATDNSIGLTGFLVQDLLIAARDFFHLEPGTLLNDRIEYPSLASWFDSDSAPNVKPSMEGTTWVGWTISVVEFLAMQEEHFLDRSMSIDRKRELRSFMMGVVRQLEAKFAAVIRMHATLNLQR